MSLDYKVSVKDSSMQGLFENITVITYTYFINMPTAFLFNFFFFIFLWTDSGTSHDWKRFIDEAEEAKQFWRR